MNTAIDELTRFQIDRQLHLQPYNVLNEHTNIVEELLESCGYDVPKEKREELSEAWDAFIGKLYEDSVITINEPVSTHDQIDAYGDIIVFAVGAISKLGYDPEKVLVEIAKEINSREGVMINGKFEKYVDKESRNKWHKANFTHAGIEGSVKAQARRKAFFAAEGYMGSEEEVERWLASLI